MPVKLKSWPGSIDPDALSEMVLDGNVWKLIRGKDFTGTPQAEASRLRTIAYKRGGTIKTKVSRDGSLVVQYLKKPKKAYGSRRTVKVKTKTIA